MTIGNATHAVSLSLRQSAGKEECSAFCAEVLTAAQLRSVPGGPAAEQSSWTNLPPGCTLQKNDWNDKAFCWYNTNAASG